MRWKPGDRVVFAKQKFSTTPGRRSRTVDASRRGEYYAYVVDKYWLVKTVLEDGQVLLVTRRGKEHRFHPNDPRLRAATLWERWRHHQRFKAIRGQLDG